MLQMEAELATLKHQYAHLQGQYAALQRQVQINQISSDSREYKTSTMEEGDRV
jgi:hypothetical protein